MVLSASTTRIRVTPETLVARASDAEQKIDACVRQLQAIQQVVNRTANYWTGEAAQSCRSQYESGKSEMEEILRRLKTQPGTLLSIANIYRQTESQAQQQSAPLPGNVID